MKKTEEMFALIILLLLTKCIVAKHDCDWVKIIYQKMGGDVSMIPQNCCRMLGVACHDGHVVGIYWSNKNLNGIISSVIGNLVNLESL